MTCIICGSTAFWPLRHRHDEHAERLHAELVSPAPYEWRLCQQCGNAYPTQAPDLRVLSRIWEVNRVFDDPTSQQARAMRDYRLRVSRIGGQRAFAIHGALHKGPPGRFLDIACGLGATVRAFADAGWQAEGVDADPSTAEFHREFGIKARIGQVETLEFNDLFDIVQISHAVYFITDPVGFFRRVKTLLKPDGLFCVNIADLMANHDTSLPSYVHSFFPTAESLHYALVCAGFTPMAMRRLSGTIYIAARIGQCPAPDVPVRRILWGYRSKFLRYALFGWPLQCIKAVVKWLLAIMRNK